MIIFSCKYSVKTHIRNYATKVKRGKILDIGCGDGEYTSLFCKAGNIVKGLDLTNTVKPEFSAFKFIKGSAEKLPFTDESFNLIISFDVLEHINNDKKAISEMYRVLKKGGKIFLETPNKERLSYWFLLLIGKKRNYPLNLGDQCIHLREYNKDELLKEFSKWKFEKLEIYPFWFGLRSNIIDMGIDKPFPFLERFCQCWFVEAKK